MGGVDPRRVVEEAAAGGYAVGAFNMHDPETTQALVDAATATGAPMFLQVGRAVVPHMGLRKAYEMTRRIAEESEADYVIHLDHGPIEEVFEAIRLGFTSIMYDGAHLPFEENIATKGRCPPSYMIEQVFEAIRLGFTSIMYDGAHLPFEENIATTRKVVEVAHSFGIPVEAELGKIPDADQVVDWAADGAAYYTDVAQAERFVAETGVDWLAVSVGIVHGVPMAAPGSTPPAPQPLDITRIKEIKAATGVPLVLHGASGIPEVEIREAMAAGVAKFNADTDLRHAFRSGIEDVWSRGDRQLEEAFAEGRARMTAATVEKVDLYRGRHA